MAGPSDRRLGMLFGLLGAVLWIIEAILDLARSVYRVAFGHGLAAIGPAGEAVLLIVLGLVVGLFSAIARDRESTSRQLVAGAVLIVVAIIGWFGLGFGGSLIALLGTVLVLIAGIVFVVSGV